MKMTGPESDEKNRVNLDDFVVYQADLSELKEACFYYVQYVQDKIEELESFCLKLRTEEFAVKTFNQWFDAKKMSKCRIHRLLAYAIRSNDTPEEKSKACLSLIKKIYRTDLVRQYRPLILCTLNSSSRNLAGALSRKRPIQSVLNRLTINGICINLDRVYTEEDFSEVFCKEMRVLEFKQTELIPLLPFYCFLIANEASNFSDVFLKKNRVGRIVQSNEIFLDWNPKESEIQIHVVRNIVAFYRIQEGEADQVAEGVPEYSGMPVLAKSTASFQLNIKRSVAPGGFFEPTPEYVDFVCTGAILEVYDANARSVIVRDLGKGLCKKIQENEIFDANDEIAIRQLTKDYEDITDFKILIRNLMADKNTLKLVLVMRMNRLLIAEVLQSPVLLVRLCSDPLCKKYLQLLKFWHMQDIRIYGSLTALLEYIMLLASDISQEAWQETVVNLFFRERENNNLLKFSALFTILNDQKKRSVYFLVQTEGVLTLFRNNNWIFLFALYFREAAYWLFTTGAIIKLGLDTPRVEELMRAHPGIWDELRKQKQSVQDLPEQLFDEDHMRTLLLQNEDKVSREAATTAINRSEKLFKKLCYLADTDPDDLLKYFSRYHKAFRANWPDEYARTERTLLSVCKESTVKRYFEAYYLSLRDPEFSQTFCTIVLENQYPAVSQTIHRVAKEVLISVFLHGLRKKRKFETIWNTSLKMVRLSESLQDEPRLVYIVRTESILSNIRDHHDRELLLAFVNCVIEHHSDPRINHIKTVVPLLKLLSQGEAATLVARVLASDKDRFFILKSLIHNPDAFGLLIMGECNFESDEFNELISSASAEHLMLLLIALHSREQELEKALTILANMPQDMRNADTDQTVTIRSELVLVNQVQRSIVEAVEKIECFFDSKKSTWMEIACLFTLYSELAECIDSDSLGRTQLHNFERAKAFVQVLQEDKVKRLTDFKASNATAFIQELNELETHNAERYFTLIDASLLRAFNSIDIRSAILNSPDLLKILISHADIRLISKFVVIFGRSEIAEDLMKIFCRRLMADRVLMDQYRPFIYLGKEACLPNKGQGDQHSEEMSLEELSWSIRHSKPQLVRQLNVQLCSMIAESASNQQVAELTPYCEASSDTLICYLEALSRFDHLSPTHVINLLILAHPLKIDISDLKGWFSYKLHPNIVCQPILNQSIAPGFVLSAIHYLLSYYSESEDLVNHYMDDAIDINSCRRADVGRTVHFMVSQVGLEVVFSEEGDVPRDLAILICELFFLCNLQQLKLFVRTEYVRILIQYIRMFNTDAQMNQHYLFPRIALILSMLYEQNPDYIEEVFEQNTQFIESFKASSTSLEIILCSNMYERSEKIRRILNIELLSDDFIFFETSPAVRQVAGRVSVLREGDGRRAPHRRNRLGGHPISVPGSSGDSEQYSSSSFTTRK